MRRIILTFVFVISSVGIIFAQFLSGYSFRKELTLDGSLISGVGVLSDFPVLIDLTDTSIRDNAMANGFDIAFTESDGTTQLDHEILDYDNSTGNILAYVRTDLTGATNKTIYVYYGNATIVSDPSVNTTWNNDFQAVLHLDESGNGSDNEFLDSSPNARHGTGGGLVGAGNNANTPDQAAGVFGQSQNFIEGNNDRIRLLPTNDDSWTAFTVQVWINPDGTGDDRIFGKCWGTGVDDETWLLRQTGGVIGSRTRVDTDNNTQVDDDDNPIAYNTGTWYLAAYSWDASDDVIRVYLNGTQVATGATAGGNNLTVTDVDETDNATIGNIPGGGRAFDGQLQEARVSNIALSADWLATQYNIENSPASFISAIGAEEGNCTPPAVLNASAFTSFITSGQQDTLTFSAAPGVLDGSNAIQWQQSTDGVAFTNSADGVMGSSGSTTDTFITSMLTQDTYFRVSVTNLSDCDITGVSNTVLVSVVAPYDPALGDYTNRRKFTTDNTLVFGDNGDIDPHTDFPILISITDTCLRTLANGGNLRSDNAFDILFTDSDGSTVLDHETELYDPVTGRLVVWVKIPSLNATTDQEIYMYYGNASVTTDPSTVNTWSNGFLGVWHMDEDPNVFNIDDATASDNDARPLNMESNDLVAGKIGNGIDMDGYDGSVGEFFVVGTDNNVPSELRITGDKITLSAWVNLSATDGNEYSIIEKSNNNQDVDISYFLGRNGNVVQARLGTPETVNNGLRLNGTTGIGTTDWAYISMTYDGDLAPANSFFVYLNAQVEDQDNRSGNIFTDAIDEFFIGGRDDATNRFFDGTVDELRVADSARTQPWLETEYTNQCNPTTFLTSGGEQGCPSPVNGGLATATDPAIFIGENTSIILSNFTNGASIQWQNSTDNITFTDIGGETGNQLQIGPLNESTYYRAEVTNGTCTDYSTVAFVSATAPILPGYSFRKCIQIKADQVSGTDTLGNFPIYLDMRNDPDLNTDNIRTYNSDGLPLDIVFSRVVGSAQVLIDHEIEYFQNDATDGSIRVWVKIPSVSSLSDTKIFMNYGNCNVTESASSTAADDGTSTTNPKNTNTWSNGFLAVWHLDDDVSNIAVNDTVEDATNTQAVGFAQGNMTTITGQLGDGMDFSGAGNDRVIVGTLNNPPAALENIGDEFTISGWVNSNNANPADRSMIELSDGTANPDCKYWFGLDGNGMQMRATDIDGDFIREEQVGGGVSSDIDDGEWHYLVMSYDGTSLDAFIDGADFGNFTSAGFAGNIDSEAGDDLLIGSRNNGNLINAEMDELRIANAARDIIWASTEFNNQSDPVYDYGDLANASNFFEVEDEESFVLWTNADAGTNNNWSNQNNWGICRLPFADETVRIPDSTDNIGGNNPFFDVASDGDTIGGLLLENNSKLNFENTGFTLNITGDVTNNSGSDFTADGTINFTGTSNQSIQGLGRTIITNMEINNSSGVNIDAPTSITTNLDFGSGHIYLTDDTLTIAAGATITGANSSSFIVTPFSNCLKQEGLGNGGVTSSVLYPIGINNSSYTPASLTNAASGTLDNYCIHVCENVYEEGTCFSGTQILTGVVNRTWFVEEDVIGGSDATLELQWNGVDEAGGFNNTNVFFSRHNGSTWQNLNTQDASGGGDPYVANASSIISFSPFSIISDPLALPIVAIELFASNNGEFVNLNWTILGFDEIDRLFIERSVESGDFQVISENFDNTNLNLHYKDDPPGGSIFYYRVKALTNSGKWVYSNIVSQTLFKTEKLVNVYPNPTNGIITIDIGDKEFNELVDVSLIKINGQLIINQSKLVNSGIVSMEFNVPSGYYFLKIENSQIHATVPLIIANKNK
ncbi:DUF2341 domain-containing protein [Hyphobacterium sp. CCMP332]|nr:DUF2341 domain-containing protein [Hyphobacterium sp. CCMP332]